MSEQIDNSATPRRVHLLLALLMLAHVVVNAWWLMADNHDIRVDEAYHLRKSGEFFIALTKDGVALDERLEEVVESQAPYPPLPYLAGAAAMAVGGFNPDRMTFTSTLLLLLIIAGVYRCARCTFSPWESLFAATCASFTPLIFGLSRYFSHDYFLAATVVWGFYCLLRSQGLTSTPWAAGFGLCCGLGLLCKQTGPLYLIGPSAALAGATIATAIKASPFRVDWRVIRRLAFNSVLVLALLGAVGGWWYVTHGEYLVEFWTTEHHHGRGIMSPAAEAVAEAVEDTIDRDGGTPGPAPSQAEPSRGFWESASLILRSYGLNYVLWLVNETFFLPGFLLLLMGLAALLHKQHRTQPLVLAATTLIVVYLLLTWLFNIRNPRYLMPLAPICVLLLPVAFRWIGNFGARAGAQALFLGWLVLVFCNVTFTTYGGGVNIFVPLFRDYWAVDWTLNHGLAICKNYLSMGAYVVHPPVRGINANDRVVRSINEHEVQIERSADDVPHYQIASLRYSQQGLKFATLRYRDRGSAWSDPGIPEHLLSPHRLEMLGEEVRQPEALESILPELEYVVLKPGDGDGWIRCTFWAAYLEGAGFKTIDHFFAPAVGRYETSWLHIMARMPPMTFDAAADVFDLAELKLYEGTSLALTPEQNALVDRQLADSVAGMPNLPLSPQVTLVGMHLARVVEGWYRVVLVLQPNEEITQDMRVFFRGRIEAAGQPLPYAYVPPGEIIWDFTPYPPSTSWRKGDVAVAVRDIKALPVPHRLIMGLYLDDATSLLGQAAESNPMDLERLPVKHPTLDLQRQNKSS